MALRLSGRLKITQVMPSSFSTLMVSYFLVAIPRLLARFDRKPSSTAITLSLSPRQGDRALGGEGEPYLAVGRQRQVGGGGDLQGDAVAHDIDPAGRSQEGHPADPPSEAVVAFDRGSLRRQPDAFRPDRNRNGGGN